VAVAAIALDLGEVGLDHLAHQLGKAGAVAPAERGVRLARVALQQQAREQPRQALGQGRAGS
jgi:hypothetical protein